MNYSVIGLGKLGASMAAAIAKRGYQVIGVDVQQHAVDAVNAGHAPVQETNLEATIAANTERLRATLSYEEAILHSDVSFVIVPTPSDAQGAFALQYAARAFQSIGRALASKRTYHLVVLTSTVLPGATRYGLLPILERESGKLCGQDFGLCYSPEFIALGSILHDFLNPDFTLVGEFDERSGSLLEACYGEFMENSPPCRRMSLENAELTKISVNTFVTTKITFANMLAELCERIPGGDIDVVTRALGSDSRIGKKYLTGALGYGGPCFPRDNVALGFMARALDCQAALAEVTDTQNRALPEKIVERLLPMIQADMTIAILGLAYKPFSHVIEESQGILLAQALSAKGARIRAYDPLSREMDLRVYADWLDIADSLENCLGGAEMVLITTPDPAFRTLTPADFQGSGATPVVVVDFWRILADSLTDRPEIHYILIGRSRDDDGNAAHLAQIWKEKTLTC